MKPRWYEIAEIDRLAGVREVPGVGTNPRILEFHRVAGGESPDEVPWCAAAACTWLEEAGVRSPRSKRARSFLTWGVQVPLRVGAIVVFKRGSDSASGHVGLAAWWDAARIGVLGGNQSDAVNVTVFSRNALLDVRWPEEEPVVLPASPITGVAAANTTNVQSAQRVTPNQGDDMFKMNNPKTTIAGIVSIVGGICNLLFALFSGQNIGQEELTLSSTAVVTGIGLIVGADAVKPSEPPKS